MICPKCGEDNSEKFRFCGMCGALLDSGAESRQADSRIADTRPTAATSIRPSAFSIPTPPVKRVPPEPSSIPRASARIEPNFPPPAAREPKIPIEKEFVPPVRRPVVVESTARQPERMVPPISGPSMLGLDLAVNQAQKAEPPVVTDRISDVKPNRDLEDLDISRSKPSEYVASNSVGRTAPSRFDDMSGDAFRQNSFTGFDKYIEQEEHKSGAGRVILLLLLLVGLAFAGWWTYNNYRGIAQKRKAQSDAASAVEVPPDSQSTPAATPAPAPAQQPATQASDVPEGPSENASPLPDNTGKSAVPNGDSSASLNSATHSAATDTGVTGAAATVPTAKATPASNSGVASAADTPSEKASPVAEVRPRTAAPARAAAQPRQPARPTVQAKAAAPRKLPPPTREPAGSRARASRVAPAEPEDTGDSSFRKAEAFLYGRGAPQNCDEAVKNLKAASAKSNAKARSAFGTMYATGHCVPRDLPTSYLWFALALRVDPNNQVLEKDLNAVWNQMTPPERQMATRMKQ